MYVKLMLAKRRSGFVAGGAQSRTFLLCGDSKLTASSTSALTGVEIYIRCIRSSDVRQFSCPKLVVCVMVPVIPAQVSRVVCEPVCEHPLT